jgi:uncharacterized GH25 family protein
MKLSKVITLAAAFAMAVPAAANAHRVWLLPSATVLSGEDPWITVDAAVSNDLFYFNHHPMPLDGLTITAPDGSEVTAENQAQGKFRSTFDVHLTKPGTYKVTIGGDDMLIGRYTLNGERKRWRGSVDTLSEIPKDAEDVEISQSQRRLETFVTSGAPDVAVLEPSGSGMELAPVTHPNDLYAGEEATFRLLVDGEAAEGVEVSIIPGGIRYRDELNEIKATTDADGAFKVTWPEPGYYWMSASVRDSKPSIPQAQRRSVSYAATLEVLAP